MENKMTKFVRVILLFASLLVLSCATLQKKEPAIIYPQNDEFRTSLGTIGVVSACFRPEFKLQKPITKGAAALQYGLEAAVGTIKVGAEFGPMGGPFVIVFIAPVAAVIGGIVGAIEGESSGRLKEPEEVLKGYLATVNFQETMRERFLSVAREQTQYPFFPLEVQGPNTLDEKVTYDSLLSKDIDTVLEIGVRKCDLSGDQGHIDPTLRLVMAVGTRLIRIKDGKVLYSRNFTYESVYFNQFSGWAANNAQPLREEIDLGFQFLAKKIMEAVFALQEPLNSQPSDVMKFE
jgi:hypothetical protein